SKLSTSSARLAVPGPAIRSLRRRAHSCFGVSDRRTQDSPQVRLGFGVTGCGAGREPVSSPGMSDVARLIDAAGAGDRQAAADLLPLVYEELRKLASQRLANERRGHTLQAT